MLAEVGGELPGLTMVLVALLVLYLTMVPRDGRRR